MNKIIAKKSFSEDLVKFEIRTSIKINQVKPGQYIILKIENTDSWIPVPILKTDPEKETITIIVYANDNKTRQLVRLNSCSKIFRIEGPYGNFMQMGNYGTVFCIGQGTGIVALLPVLTALRTNGNRIITVLSAKSKEDILLENEINAVSDEVIVYSDDESCNEKESVFQTLGQAARNNLINQVFVVGSAKLIKETFSHATRFGIPVQAVLYLGKAVKNGIHGIFKVNNCGIMNAVCVDGFNFNAHYPNFDEMIKRFGCDENEISRRLITSGELTISV